MKWIGGGGVHFHIPRYTKTMLAVKNAMPMHYDSSKGINYNGLEQYSDYVLLFLSDLLWENVVWFDFLSRLLLQGVKSDVGTFI